MLKKGDNGIPINGPVINIQNWDEEVVDITDAASDDSFELYENNVNGQSRVSQVITTTPWSHRTCEKIQINGSKRPSEVALPPLINPGVRVYGNEHKDRDVRNVTTTVISSPGNKRSSAITSKLGMPLLEEQNELTSILLPNMQQEGSAFTPTPPRSPKSPTSPLSTIPRRDSDNSLSSRSLLSVDSPRLESISPRPPSSPRTVSPRVLARRASTPRLELRPPSPPFGTDSFRSVSPRSPNGPTYRSELRPPSPPGENESFRSTSARPPSGLMVSRTGRFIRSDLGPQQTLDEFGISNGNIHTAGKQLNKRISEKYDKPTSNTNVHHVNAVDVETLKYDILDKEGAVVSIADVSPDILEKVLKRKEEAVSSRDTVSEWIDTL